MRFRRTQPSCAAPAARRARGGSVMLEFVLAFPIILTLLLGCMQIAHIWLARQVVCYAAFCAARSALVCKEGEFKHAAQQAGEQVCAWIVIGQAAGETEKQIPGWGTIPGSGAVGRKTTVTVAKEGQWNIEATVQFDFALVIPIAGPVIGWLVNPWRENSEWLEQRVDDTGNIGDADSVRYPHLRFTETVYLPKPYITLVKMGIPTGAW